MKVTIEELEQCELLLTMEVEPKKERKLLEKAARKIARQVRVPGFRPGKAPYNVIVRRFGAEAVQQEALEAEAGKLVEDALSEADLTPFAQVSLDSVEWEPLILKIKVPTQPVVELGDYRSIRLDYEPVVVTDYDVQAQLVEMQEQNAVWMPVERPAETGDLVTMSRVEKDGDVILAKEESAELELDPLEEHEGHDHPDNITPLLGLSAGDTKTFVLSYSDSYQDDRYAGKDITIEVEILSVKEKELEPLDDDFAQSMSDFETLEALKDSTREKLLEQQKQQQMRELGSQVIGKILENATVKWPVALEDENVKRELERVKQEMSNYGLTMEIFFQMRNTSEEEFTEQLREQIVQQFEHDLIVDKVADLEKIEVGESEILERAKYIADLSGGGEQFWRSVISSPNHVAQLAGNLARDKALERLAEIAKGEAPSLEEIEAAAKAREEAAAEADSETATEAESKIADILAETDEAEVLKAKPVITPVMPAAEAVISADTDEVAAVDADNALGTTPADTEK